MLKPALARGELHCVGATTLNEYRKYIEKDAALERRFQQVLVQEPSLEDTIAILRGIKEKYEVHHGVRIQDAATVAAATLSNRYITDRFLPDKAIDLIDEAASRLRIEIDSMPTEIDEVDRKRIKLEIEREALKKEKDKSSTGAARQGGGGTGRRQRAARQHEGPLVPGKGDHPEDPGHQILHRRGQKPGAAGRTPGRSEQGRGNPLRQDRRAGEAA